MSLAIRIYMYIYIYIVLSNYTCIWFFFCLNLRIYMKPNHMPPNLIKRASHHVFVIFSKTN